MIKRRPAAFDFAQSASSALDFARAERFKKLLLLCAAALAFGCGAVQTCNTNCDCTATTATLKCPGEYVCVSGTCEYQCRSQCSELPYTCASGEECNGTICSARKCG